MTRNEELSQRAKETTEQILAEGVCLSDGECEITDRVVLQALQQVEQQAKVIEAFEELVKMNGVELTNLIKENKTLREALQAICGGISGDLLGTTSMDRETMQSIAQQALKEVSG